MGTGTDAAIAAGLTLVKGDLRATDAIRLARTNSLRLRRFRPADRT